MEYYCNTLPINPLTRLHSYHRSSSSSSLLFLASPQASSCLCSPLHTFNPTRGRRTTFSLPCSFADSVVPEGPPQKSRRLHPIEEFIEKGIFNCRFLTLMAIGGSLAGSLLCFFKGCTFVKQSFVEYFNACWHGIGTGNVIFLLVEALDVYLMGTVMLIFGMGLYELFVSSLEISDAKSSKYASTTARSDSNLFGLFQLQKNPVWLQVRSLEELKAKLGHVIVMILLVGLFEKSKKVHIHSAADLFFLAAAVFLSAGCLFLLSKLHSSK